jgi:hypothetical protein
LYTKSTIVNLVAANVKANYLPAAN